MTRKRRPTPVIAAVPPFVDDCCANCLAPLPDNEKGLFCGEGCQQTAALIRYWRRVVRDGRIELEDVRLVIRTRVMFSLMGGYPAKARHLSAKVRRQVIERDGGKCRQCGADGTEIDHIAGDSRDLNNLQLLCATCHAAKTTATLDLLMAAGAAEAAEADVVEVGPDPAFLALLGRAFAETPTLLCDDPDSWVSAWLPLRMARARRLVDALEEAGYDPADFRRWTRTEKVDALFEANAGNAGSPIAEDDDSGYGPGSYFERAMSKDD